VPLAGLKHLPANLHVHAANLAQGAANVANEKLQNLHKERRRKEVFVFAKGSGMSWEFRFVESLVERLLETLDLLESSLRRFGVCAASPS